MEECFSILVVKHCWQSEELAAVPLSQCGAGARALRYAESSGAGRVRVECLFAQENLVNDDAMLWDDY